MAKRKLTSLVASRLGNHRTRKDLLGQASFPGLTIDNLTTTSSGSLASTIGQQVAGISQQSTALNAQQQSEAQLLNQPLTKTAATTSSSSSSSMGDTLVSAARSLLGGVFGLTPILEGLFSLFSGGGSTPAAQPLTQFTLPSSIQYAAGVNGSGGTAVPVDYGQGGQVRSLAEPATTASPTSSTQTGSTVHVNVSAMDSKSFLDHSDDIASAVRAALLNSHPLNDVIASL